MNDDSFVSIENKKMPVDNFFYNEINNSFSI